MILEVAPLQVRAGQADAFEAAFRGTRPFPHVRAGVPRRATQPSSTSR